MSPFAEYLDKSKELREEYKQLIEANPDKKDTLEKELKDKIAELLNVCEKKEQEATKHL